MEKTTKIFNTDIKLKANHCSLNGCCDCPKVEVPYVNLYVKISDVCNAKCSFCNFKHSNKKFDRYKFYYVLNEMRKTIRVNKVSFTGGEPTLSYLNNLSQSLDMVKIIDPEIFTAVNTNGHDFSMIEGLQTIDNISLSRHHYNDKTNDELFGAEMIVTPKISVLYHKDKINLSCNLIKGYIDSGSEVLKYLEYADSVGIHYVGFVVLMNINEYCNKNRVTIEELNIDESKLFRVKDWKNGNACNCRNYLYTTNAGNIIRVYFRCYNDLNNDKSILVFDGENLLKGFNGQIVI